jgi:D-alanyl-D-alanine carboxypeptidase
MSISPFMTPGQSQQRRALAARRRRRRRVLAVSLVVLVATVIVLLLLGVGSTSSSGHRAAPTARTGPHRSGAPAVALSPAGLPLAQPAFALSGLSDPARDPLQIPFHHPPHEGILVNLSSGQVLWQRDAEQRVPIASLTKMMTALLAVRSGPPEAPVLITKEAIEQQGSKVGEFPLGHHVPLESVLYGLLLPSGNDAAVALALHAAGSVRAFVADMNAEAAHLGLGCTRYSSPSGFYDAGNFSCAADLAQLAHIDIEQPRIASITRTYTAAIPFPIKGGKLYLTNNNPLLIYGYPGVTGMKTGYTLAAGRCLVATAERHGVRLVAIVLNSTEPGRQDAELLDAGFQDIYHLPPVPSPPLPPGA